MKKYLILSLLFFSVVLVAQKKDAVLITIGGEEIMVSEFKRVYEKNLDAIDNEEAKDLEKNLDLFINYKLKVNEAYALKLDTLPSYIKEMKMYRNQLAAPYLQDSLAVNRLIKDAYYRTKNEVKAKHILIKIPKASTAEDTLRTYTKILEIRNRILNGEDFEKLAVETSEDPSARTDQKSGRAGNKGNLGYFSAFKMVYPFEDAAYTTKIGKISMPFRTRFGYHILKVDDIRPSKGEVEVAHILIQDLSFKGEELITSIYNRLENDEQFKMLARKYSDDTGSKSKGGKLRRFGAGVMVEPFNKVAFSLTKEGSYSKPFKTRFGWHIIQLIKKHPVGTFNELKQELANKIRSNERLQLSEKAVVDKLKKMYSVTEYDNAKEIFNNANIRTMAKDSLNLKILKINEKELKQIDFINFIKRKNNTSIFDLFKDFKEQEILKYYKDNLEKTEPEFASIIQEYEDGLLLFELMQRKIWDKASKDTLGLQRFHKKNVKKYNNSSLDIVKGEVINDFQNHLEDSWIKEMRNKSVIEIRKKALKKLKKYYNKNK
ncbi:peptidylprolyl isomerase [Polaribacter sp.]|uniref:peptidylprolyl isomerase n=1 Tax=Polaribacter sp. TaxID=1920175 RepID=UPI0025F5CB61|nr:peptidylprolyl isomerase [Polaribacter sp.]